MADIFDVVAVDKVQATLEDDIEIKPLATTEAQIAEFIDRFYGFELSVDGILNELETGEVDYTTVDGKDEFSQPLVRLVNSPCIVRNREIEKRQARRRRPAGLLRAIRIGRSAGRAGRG